LKTVLEEKRLRDKVNFLPKVVVFELECRMWTSRVVIAANTFRLDFLRDNPIGFRKY
jgi:hypothetical protein